jgi:hypothetical protein
MGSNSKTLGLVLVILFFTSLVFLPSSTVKAQPTNQAPSLEFQKEYGDSRTEVVSNLIQTSDGGYAFMDIGWGTRSHFNLLLSIS